MKHLLATFIFFVLPPLCSCLPHDKISEEEYAGYDLILKGTIEKITPGNDKRTLCLNVDVVYKGTLKQDTVLVQTPHGAGLCGINAGTGGEWLIFAHFENGTYTTNMCSRSKNLDPGNHMYQFQKGEIIEDLAFLEQKLPDSKN